MSISVILFYIFIINIYYKMNKLKTFSSIKTNNKLKTFSSLQSTKKIKK